MAVLKGWICVKTGTMSSGRWPTVPIVIFQPGSSSLWIWILETYSKIQTPELLLSLITSGRLQLSPFSRCPFLSHMQIFSLWVRLHSFPITSCMQRDHSVIYESRPDSCTSVQHPPHHGASGTLPHPFPNRDVKRFEVLGSRINQHIQLPTQIPHVLHRHSSFPLKSVHLYYRILTTIHFSNIYRGNIILVCSFQQVVKHLQVKNISTSDTKMC